MNYRNQKLASRHVAKKLGAALSTAALVAPTVAAVAPQVALADDATTTLGNVKFTYDEDNVYSIEAYFVDITLGTVGGTTASTAVVVKTDGTTTTAKKVTGKTTADGTKVADADNDAFTAAKLIAAFDADSEGADFASIAAESDDAVKAAAAVAGNLATVVVTPTAAGEITGLTHGTNTYSVTEGTSTKEFDESMLKVLAGGTIVADSFATGISVDTKASTADLRNVVKFDTTAAATEDAGYDNGGHYEVNIVKADGTSVLYGGSATKVALADVDSLEIMISGGYHFMNWPAAISTRISAADESDATITIADGGDVEEAFTEAVGADNTVISGKDLLDALKLIPAGTVTLTMNEIEGSNFTLALDPAAGTATPVASQYAVVAGTKKIAGAWSFAGGNAFDEKTNITAPAGQAFAGWTVTDPVSGGTYLVKSLANLDAKIANAVTLDGASLSGTVSIAGTPLKVQEEDLRAFLIKLSRNENDATVTLTASYGTVAAAAVSVLNYTPTLGTVTLAGGTKLTTATSYLMGTTVEAATAEAKTGFTFAGWYAVATANVGAFSTSTAKRVSTSATLTAQEISDNVIRDTSAVAQPTTYIAVFTGDAVAVKFDANGGTLKANKKALEDKVYAPGSYENTIWKVAGANEVWEKAGYTVVGWSVDPDCLYNDEAHLLTDNDGNKNADSVLSSTAEGKTLYAVWGPAANTHVYEFISSDEDMGTVSKADIVTKVTAVPDISVTATAKQGYTFDGWFLRTYNGAKKAVVLKAVNDKSGADYTGATLNQEVVKATLGIQNQAAAATLNSFVAKFHADKYTAVFGTEKVDYTVGVDAELKAGDWYDAKGNKVETKAQLDALVEKDGDAVILTGKATPTVKAGWYKDSDGDYHYATAVVDGERVDAKGWSRGGTTKYYYYFDLETGKMLKNAWTKSGAYWYHFGARGAMEHDRDIDYKGTTYHLNSRGAAVKKA